MLSFLRYSPFQLLSYFRYKFFMLMLSSSHCCCWCVIIHWRILYYPLHSFLEELGVIRNRIKNLHFFNKFFSLCFCISCVLFLFFCFFACGVSLITFVFGNKHKPLYFWQFYIFVCFAVFYLCLHINNLHHI